MKALAPTLLAAFTLAAAAPVRSQQPQPATAYPGWGHTGTLMLLTTPEGANLPADAAVAGFPVLVRLHQDWFNFKQALPNGEDLRFSDSHGAPLAYQVEAWDAAAGSASVWVCVPNITGNSRQPLHMHWGKAAALSESNGKAVFNASNGFVSVWHMTEPLTDEVGTLESKDAGTTASAGMIGPARHFAGGQGIFGGDKIANYPADASPHSSEAWFRAETGNGHILAWGNEQRQGKVVVSLASPPHVRVDAYFSGANVAGDSPLALGAWTQVVHTYTEGEARVYVNGVLDGVTKTGPPLAMKRPAHLWIGGWWNKYNFVGDIDEVRVSKVARTAAWVKLQYENQKPLQTLVGPLIQPGDAFGVAPGQLTVLVSATLANGGKPSTRTASITVTEPALDPWIARSPAKDEQPEDGQFYARDDKNEGTLFYNGTLGQPADSVFLKVYADDQPYQAASAKPAADRSYALSIKLKPGLVKYRIEFGTKTGGRDTLLRSVGNLVCGDAYIIQGQSNALATDTREESPPDTSEWIRSFGRPPAKPQASPSNLWCSPVWKAKKNEPAELGYWGMELAKRLVAGNHIPVCFINGAVGGTRIDEHQRNDADPTDLTTIYGRTLWRVQQAKLSHGIRGILWHQGENNQGSASPTGDYDWKSYQDYFVALAAAWEQDFPNLRHYSVFQIWPNACSMAGTSGGGDHIREIQRSLPLLFSNLSVMSTLGVQPAGGCHFPLSGWAGFARLIQPLIERDTYGKHFADPITPPNLKQAAYASAAKDSIRLEFDQPLVWMDSLTSQFYLDGGKDQIASGSVLGNVLTLKLKAPATAQHITYLKEKSWNQNDLLLGTNGIAALTFCDVPLAK